jgi:uncharacterized coiled-coil protein SlyX
MKTTLRCLFIALALLASIHQTNAQGTTAFAYQGQLRDGGTNANGAYTMIFNLYDSPGGGNLIGGPITTSATLANGLFTVNLDFGAGAFNGSARYLDITIANGGATQELSPRVQVLPSPYAIFTSMANTANNLNAGTNGNAVTFNNSGNNFNGAFTGNGGGLTDVNAAELEGLNTNDFALLNGNQDLTGNNTFENDVTLNQDILMGDWDIGIDEYNGIPDILTFSQDGNYRMVILPEGYGSGDGSDAVYGMRVYGNISCDSIDMSGNGTGVIAGVTTIEGDGDGDGIILAGATVNGSLGADEVAVSGDVAIQGNLTVGGTINGGDGDGDDVIVAKTGLTSTSSQDILNRVAQLSISSWNSKKDSKHAASHHITPKAHDFNAAFGFENDNHFINLADETGVALAAIQGLNEKLTEKEAEIQKLKSQNDSFEKRLADLEQLVKTSAQK